MNYATEIQEHCNQLLMYYKLAEEFEKKLNSIYNGTKFKVIKEPIRGSYFTLGEVFEINGFRVCDDAVYIINHSDTCSRTISPNFIKFLE